MSLSRASLFLMVVGCADFSDCTRSRNSPLPGWPRRSSRPESQPNSRDAGAPAANEIIQDFPTNDAAKTAWKIDWATSRGYGLIIQDAWYRKHADEPYIQVLGDVRLGEMFVPYHSGSPRFWDVSYNFRL